MCHFRDAAFGELPTSMDTESSNGKEGVVTALICCLHAFHKLNMNCDFIGGSPRVLGNDC